MVRQYMSLYEAQRREKKKYKTTKNTFAMFPRGTRVKIICHHCDGYFFYGERGTVTGNTGRYLGITVTFDEARKFEDGHIQRGHSFNPSDLYRYKRQPLKRLRKPTDFCRVKKSIDSLRCLLPDTIFIKLEKAVSQWHKQLEKADKKKVI